MYLYMYRETQEISLLCIEVLYVTFFQSHFLPQFSYNPHSMLTTPFLYYVVSEYMDTFLFSSFFFGFEYLELHHILLIAQVFFLDSKFCLCFMLSVFFLF